MAEAQVIMLWVQLLLGLQDEPISVICQARGSHEQSDVESNRGDIHNIRGSEALRIGVYGSR